MPKSSTFSPAEVEFEKILRDWGFKTATLKTSVKAPSIEDGRGNYIIIPDILAVDRKEEGWCFEVKDEATSSWKMNDLAMNRYSGPVWLLEERKARSYLDFSKAFDCPCVIAIGDENGWRVGFFTRKSKGKVNYNKRIVAINWIDPDGIPVLFNVMSPLDIFLGSSTELRRLYWN